MSQQKTRGKQPKKIEVMREQVTELLDDIHLDRHHAVALTTFDDEVTCYPFTSRGAKVQNQVAGLRAGGQTAAYDAMIASFRRIAEFQTKTKTKNRPAVVLTFTDGKENSSENDEISDVRTYIRRLGFFEESHCWNFIVGVGDDVSDENLRAICQESRRGNNYGEYISVNDIHDLGETFKRSLTYVGKVAIKKGIITPDKKIEKRREVDYARVVPMAYMLNLDISGSMGKKV